MWSGLSDWVGNERVGQSAGRWRGAEGAGPSGPDCPIRPVGQTGPLCVSLTSRSHSPASSSTFHQWRRVSRALSLCAMPTPRPSLSLPSLLTRIRRPPSFGFDPRAIISPSPFIAAARNRSRRHCFSSAGAPTPPEPLQRASRASPSSPLAAQTPYSSFRAVRRSNSAAEPLL